MKNKFMMRNPIMDKNKTKNNMNMMIIEMRNITNKILNTDQKIVA
jgi:hypothetical protein